MENKLIEKMKSGKVAPGIWINSTDPQIAEIAATYGAEWLLIDLEHEPIGRSHLTSILMTCKGTDCQPIVRVPENREVYYKWVLDLGAAGVVVPQIKGYEDARLAVEYAKYRPVGERGVGPMRACKYYSDGEYIRRANEETMLMVQIENAGGLKDIEKIVSLPGVDAVFLGPGDLSDSLGHFWQFDHPEFVKALDTITSTCNNANMPMCVPAFSEELFKRYYEKGIRGILVMSDYRALINTVTSSLESAKRLAE